MYKNLRWKLITIAAVFVVFFSIGVYPLLSDHYHWPCPAWLKATELKLGLDLKGGVHLRLKVNTDDALKITSTSTSEQLRTSGITVASITVPAPAMFRVEGVPPDKDSQFRAAADEVAGTLYDRNPLPSGTYEFRLKPIAERDLREQAVDQTMQTIDRRVNELGVAEPSIARQSNGEEILIQLPGDMEIVQGSSERGGGGEALYYIVRKVAPVTGQDLRSAKPGLDENNQPAVHFELKPQGGQKFGKLSGENIGRYLAIVLDNRVVSAPRLDGRITEQGRISGGFTAESANDLALTL